MEYLKNRLSIKLAVTISLIIAPLLLASFFWLGLRNETIAQQEQETRATQVAESLLATLSSIMLSGNADIAHAWLKQVATVTGVESAKIFRTDGVEAFQDHATLNKVNDYIGKQQFSRNTVDTPARVSAELASLFNHASQGEIVTVRSDDGLRLNYLSPIRVQDACMACHGYDSNPVRGVLALTLATDSFAATTSETKKDMLNILALIVILLALTIWLVVRKQVLTPLKAISNIASNIMHGDLSSNIKLDRNDELGVVASTFDLLVHDMKEKITYEFDLRRRQEAITDAVISLGKSAASVSLLEHIGEICREITGAPYAMLSYLQNGEKRFIWQGLSEEIEANISHKPEGQGLIGLLWNKGETVRVEHMMDHPDSCGFPDGHPPMDAFLGTPIRFQDKILGVIYLAKNPGDSPFTREDENALVILASACAIALSNTQNFERVQLANAELEERVTQRTHELNQSNKQLKTREIELELMNEDLISANRAKDQFLANTSHELRTPLNAIIGFSELLSDARAGELNPKQQRYVGHVHNSGKRLLSIINDLLDISKIESGMMEIHETVFNPVELGLHVVAEMKPLADAKRIDLNLVESMDHSLNIQSDKDKLHQILVNLIGNALKFTPEKGKVEITMELDQSAQRLGDAALSCSVRDNGIGIPLEDQEKIFLPFIQASGGLNREHGGTGLGLSLARRMVELLGGGIKLQSELDNGSTFLINLPIVVTEADIADTHASAASAAASHPGQPIYAPTEEVFPDTTPHPLIMIVDANPDRAARAEEMFSVEGYQVVRTDMDHVEASASSALPFLIVLGIPDDSASTYERIQHLKRSPNTKKIPTILMAGEANNPRFSTGGTISQIEKSIQRNDLLEMVSYYGKHISPAPSAPTVLVVDDDASVREYMKETLAPEGYHILLASNGDEGIRLAIAREPDLIILDLMMPGTTGFDVVDQLREHPTACDIPVVIFTAKDLTREEALLLGHDVERILIKGITKRADVLSQLQKLELLYPLQAKLIDAKLGCFNQRYMQRRLEHEIARSVRYAHNFSLIAWQMDGYDNYCKVHGKRWGMAALKATVSTAQSIIRRGDVLARLGESSFILLLPGISVEGSSRVAEKIRLRISHQRLPLPGDQAGKLTASIGLVKSGDGNDASELMDILHQRLNMAVAEGGNRTIIED